MNGKDYKPMLCRKSEPFSSDDYLFEPKLDGVRCIAYIDKGICTLVSREGNDITATYPEIGYNFHSGGVFDGEIVVLDERGVPSFNHLQHRQHRTNPLQIRHAQRVYPAVFFIFDVLQEFERGDTTGLPLHERKRILHGSSLSTLSKQQDSSIRLVPYMVGDGLALFHRLIENGWEGVVAKPLNSTYVGNNRSFWRKSKARREGEFVICGLTQGQGNRENGVGALVLGEETERGLVYVGEAGSGLTFHDVQALPRWLVESTCPFDPVPKLDDLWYWVVPEVHVEVEYFERSPNGKLRFPSVKRIKVRTTKR